MGICWSKCCKRQFQEENELLINHNTVTIEPEPMKKSKLNPTAPQVEVRNKSNLRVQNKVPAGEDCKFVRRNSWKSRQGDENIQFQSNEGIDQNALTKRMEKYTISLPHLKETKVGITLEQIYASSRLKKRDIISCQKREDSLQRKNLHTSEERIQFFKRELQKNRISFMEDSITLVIDRNNIVKDTINQISSTDRFSFYKEVKIFFVGEEAQDAGGVLKEWIFYLIQTILSTPNEINFREEFAQTRNNRKLLRSKSLTDSKEESKRKINENASFRNGSPDSNSSRVRFPKSKLSSKSAHFGESEESELLDSVKGRGRSNVEICKSGDEVYYHLKSTGSLKICKLLGQIVGKAIFEDIPLEPKFTNFMLKCILSQDFEIQDCMTYDQSLSSSFTYIKENVISQYELGMNFTIQDKDKGIYELVKDGENIKVNNYTKHAYINLFLEYFGYHKAYKQISAFLEGLNSIIPRKLLNILTVEDLKKLLVGKTEINLDDWKANTVYKGETLHHNHPTISTFWKIISSLEDHDLRKFLQFATGCRSIPIDGFKSLKNNRQEECLFTINLVNVSHNFIRAHTCFNRIDLPVMEELQLKKSIDHILSMEQFIFDFE